MADTLQTFKVKRSKANGTAWRNVSAHKYGIIAAYCSNFGHFAFLRQQTMFILGSLESAQFFTVCTMVSTLGSSAVAWHLWQ